MAKSCGVDGQRVKSTITDSFEIVAERSEMATWEGQASSWVENSSNHMSKVLDMVYVGFTSVGGMFNEPADIVGWFACHRKK